MTPGQSGERISSAARLDFVIPGLGPGTIASTLPRLVPATSAGMTVWIDPRIDRIVHPIALPMTPQALSLVAQAHYQAETTSLIV